MSPIKRIFQHKSSFTILLVWVFLLIIWTIYWTFREVVRINIENTTRDSARQMAKWIWDCIYKEIKHHDFSSISEMMQTIHNCWSEFRSWWPTWDFFVFDRISKKMVYDGSPDCMKWWANRPFYWKNEVAYLKDSLAEWECWMHQDKEQCKNAIYDLYNIGNTDKYSKIRWQFDDSHEWLESYVIPWMRMWLSGIIWKSWTKDDDNIQLQIVMWTQKDEIFAKRNLILLIMDIIFWSMYVALVVAVSWTAILEKSLNNYSKTWIL